MIVFLWNKISNINDNEENLMSNKKNRRKYRSINNA